MIQAVNLHKSFRLGEKTIPVLTGVNLSIQKGEMVSIMGASGAGKSTFLHLLGGLYRPTSGQVLFEGQNIFTQNDEAIAQFRNKTIGFVFQFHHLLPAFTALENVMIPGWIQGISSKNIEPTARRLLVRVGLEARISHKPGELSGGEQQRVAIARALVLNPKLVLADEPTGNLDAQTGDTVFTLLKEMHQQNGTTLVVVTHNEALAAQADRVLKMADGSLEEISQESLCS